MARVKRRHNALRSASALVALLAWCALDAHAQDDGTTLARTVDRLGSDAWMERELADEALTHADAFDLDALAGQYQRDDLGPEQRLRLWRAMVNRFRLEPKGGLGVSFGSANEGAVSIESLVPGFPAGALLQPGDAIVAVDGRLVTGQTHLRAEILSRLPGDVMATLLRRKGLLIEADLPLGAYSLLQDPASLDEQSNERAMRLRLARRGIEPPHADRVGDGAGADDWIDAAFPDKRAATGDDNGQRRTANVLTEGTPDSMERMRSRQAFWIGWDVARKESDDQQRAEAGRRLNMTVGIRAIYVEYERSLQTRIGQQRRAGEPTEYLEGRLAWAHDRMRELDERLADDARWIEKKPDPTP